MRGGFTFRAFHPQTLPSVVTLFNQSTTERNCRESEVQLKFTATPRLDLFLILRRGASTVSCVVNMTTEQLSGS